MNLIVIGRRGRLALQRAGEASVGRGWNGGSVA